MIPAKRKPSKSMAYQNHPALKSIDRVREALACGGHLETRELWNKTEYWLYYIQGGCTRITKPIYDKLKT